MQISICDIGTMTLADGTLAILADQTGKIIATLTVRGDCWVDVSAQPSRVDFDATKEEHIATETTTSLIPAGIRPVQIVDIEAVKVCRDRFGRIVSCPPR